MDSDRDAKERIERLCRFVASLPEPKRPPIVSPEGCATAEQIFRYVDPAMVPEIAETLEWLMEHEPGVIAATAEVDRRLIWDAMKRTPLENLRFAAQLSHGRDDIDGDGDDEAAG